MRSDIKEIDRRRPPVIAVGIDKQFYKKELSFRQKIARRAADPEDRGLRSA